MRKDETRNSTWVMHRTSHLATPGEALLRPSRSLQNVPEFVYVLILQKDEYLYAILSLYRSEYQIGKERARSNTKGPILREDAMNREVALMYFNMSVLVKVSALAE